MGIPWWSNAEDLALSTWAPVAQVQSLVRELDLQADQWQEIVIINFKNNIVKSPTILVSVHMVYTFIYSLYIFIYSFLTLTYYIS